MSDSNPERTEATVRTPEQFAKAKKPYRKPSFQHERVFETMALNCGKVQPHNHQCRFNRKVS